METIVTNTQRADKDDSHKIRYDLISNYGLEQLARVYTYGSFKYGKNNWKLGLEWCRVFAAIIRHLMAWKKGEDLDPESGLPHLAHAAWGCFTLIAYKEFDLGEDDRNGD